MAATDVPDARSARPWLHHRQARRAPPPYSMWSHLLAAAIALTLLYFGGFFAPLAAE